MTPARTHPQRPRIRTAAALLLALAGLAPACAARPSAAPEEPAVQACTKEAKICPDGSTVGRTGPNCEFAPCPGPAPDAPPAEPTTPGAATTPP